MPAVRTITRAVDNRVSVQIPSEYASYSLEVIILPFLDESRSSDVRNYSKFPTEQNHSSNANNELASISGKWIYDSECETALDEMRNTIDQEMWK